jgi:hypothetical protein
MTLEMRGKLAFWGTLGLIFNGLTFFLGFWMPVILFVSAALLLLALDMKGEDSTDI